MSVLAPDTVIEGRSYILCIKDGDVKTGPDSVYAIVNRGNSRFGYQDFEFVCKTSNKKLFFTNKVNDGQMGSTWAHCVYEMKVKKKPVGNPVCMTDRAYSFSEIVTWAYQNKEDKDYSGTGQPSPRSGFPAESDCSAAGSNGSAAGSGGSAAGSDGSAEGSDGSAEGTDGSAAGSDASAEDSFASTTGCSTSTGCPAAATGSSC